MKQLQGPRPIPGRIRKVGAILAALLVVASAQTQIATVSSDAAFQLRGANVMPGQGVPSWPVMPGDEIKAGEGMVTISFSDGSTITLAPEASARFSVIGQTPIFQLISGAAHYALKNQDSVVLMTGKNVHTVKGLVGDLQMGGGKPQAGWWTASHTAAVAVGGLSATGLAVGVVQAAKKPPKVSCGGQTHSGNNNCQ